MADSTFWRLRTVVATWALVSAAVAATPAAAAPASAARPASGSRTGSGATSPYDVLEQLARVLVVIENEYVEPVDRRKLIEGGIEGMVSNLDPHSSFLPAADYKIFRSDTEGRFGGIGVEVDFGGGKVTIIAPIDGSPAARAGIASGDEILEIDRKSVAGKSPAELVKLMRGKPGTTVRVTLSREGTDPFEVVLERQVIKVSSVLAKRLDRDVGYLRIKQFQSGTHRELLQAVARLRQQKLAGGTRPLAGIVLDLRNNPGGLVDEAAAVADEFLASGVIYTTRSRGRVIDTVTARSVGSLQRGPLVILVNDFSASAAELVAGALQDHHRGIVVGTGTFGKGSVQSILDLPRGDGLRLTTMLYYTPAGRTIQARGIRPTVLVNAEAKEAPRYRIVREADLDNHLEGRKGRQQAPRSREDDDTTHLGVTRKIPLDPTGGKDVILSIGYQLVTGVLP